MKFRHPGWLLALVLALTPVWAMAAGLSAEQLFQTALSPHSGPVEGRFRQEKTLKDIGATLESRGVFSFSEQQGLRWHVRQPVATELLITRDAIVEIEDGEEVMRMAAEDQPATAVISELFFAMFTGDREAMERYFELSHSGTGDDWSLVLDPRDGTIGTVMETIELRGGERVQELLLQEVNGDSTRIFIEELSPVEP